MSFTRFHDDQARVEKQLEQMTALGRYMINVPGNGMNPLYYENPHVRLEKWGGNLMTNTIGIDNELKGLTRPLNRDLVNNNQYTKYISGVYSQQYKTGDFDIDESRALQPAWELRDKEGDRWDYLHTNPQENVALQFQNNLSTRVLEKDHYYVNNCDKRNRLQ